MRQALTFFLGNLLVASAASAGALQDYVVGRIVAQCVAGPCHVFRGTIVTDSPQSGQPVRVRVEQTLHGTGAKESIIALPYVAAGYKPESGTDFVEGIVYMLQLLGDLHSSFHEKLEYPIKGVFQCLNFLTTPGELLKDDWIVCGERSLFSRRGQSFYRFQ